MLRPPLFTLTRGEKTILKGDADDVGSGPNKAARRFAYVVGNAGDGAITVTGVTVSGTGNVTAVADGTTIEVTGKMAGNFTVFVTIEHDAPGSPFTFSITGTTTQGHPELVVKRGDDTILVSDPLGGVMSPKLTYTVVNAGNDDLHLLAAISAGNFNGAVATLTPPPSTTFAPGASATFDVAIDTLAGPFTFDITLTSDGGNLTFTVTGTGLVPEIAIDEVANGMSLDLGSVFVGGPNPARALTVHNDGTGLLVVRGAMIDQLSNCTVTATLPSGIVEPGFGSDFSYAVTTGGAGLFSFRVTIDNDDADENPYQFVIGGAVGPEIEVDDLASGGFSDFGNFAYGGSGSKTYTIRNVGTTSLSLSGSVATSGAPQNVSLTIVPPASSVAASGSTTFTVKATPLGQGPFSALLVIPNNDLTGNEAPFAITVHGAMLVGDISVARGPSGIATGGTDDAGFIDVGSRAYTIKNAGGGALNLGTVTLTNKNGLTVTVSQPLTTQLAAGASTTFDVQISGTASSWSFDINIPSDDPFGGEELYVIHVSGTGTP